MATPFTPQDNQGNSQKFNTDGSVIISDSQAFTATNPDLAFGDDQRLRVGQEEMLFYDDVQGATLNTNNYNTTLSTMTVAQAAGLITLNSGLSLAANTYAILASNKQFYRFTEFPLYGQFIVQITSHVNAVMEWGLANFSTNAAVVSDGVFLRNTSNGQIYLVQSFNNSENITLVVTSALDSDNDETVTTPWVPNPASFYICEITIREALINLDIQAIGDSDDTLSMIIPIASSRPAQISVSHLPAAARVYNTASAALVASTLALGAVNIQQMDLAATRPYVEQLVILGKGAYQGPNTTAGLTETANHVNSTSPTSATLSNTAAGYTTLGGRYQFVPVTGAATDYCLFGYQVPTGVDLIIYGVRISAAIATALGATAEFMDWSIAVNSSAVSLATAEGAGTWAPRRIPVGTQGFLASAPAGTVANDINIVFNAPIVCNGGRFVQIILQISVGTTTGLIRGDVAINGVFE